MRPITWKNVTDSDPQWEIEHVATVFTSMPSIYLHSVSPIPTPPSPHSRDPALLCGLGKEKKCMSFERVCLSVGSEASE